RQAVVGDRLPGRRVGDELAHAGPDARVTVEGAHPDAHPILVLGVTTEHRRSALFAEQLFPAAIRPPGPQLLLARDQPKRAALRSCVGGGGGSTAPLTRVQWQ